VSFAAGETSKTITVNVAGDTAVEPDESFTVTLSAPTGATIGTVSASGTIYNDDDPLLGGPGDDSLAGTDLADTLHGFEGNDTLFGGGGNDSLLGGTGDDSLFGVGGNDTLNGEGGADTLFGGGGADLLQGGPGNDLYIIDALDTIVDTGGQNDRVQSAESYTLLPGFESLTLTGAANLSGTGNAAGNSLIGNGGGNLLRGLEGNDTISAGFGNDTVVGGMGADLLDGGPDADVFRYGSAAEGGDTITRYRGLDDSVEVSAAGFGGGLAAGLDVVAAGRYVIGTGQGLVATLATGQFLYDTVSRTLSWDVDGTGASEAVMLFRLNGPSGWAGSEIVVVA